jgi:hypothetical protein
MTFARSYHQTLVTCSTGTPPFWLHVGLNVLGPPGYKAQWMFRAFDLLICSALRHGYTTAKAKIERQERSRRRWSIA